MLVAHTPSSHKSDTFHLSESFENNPALLEQIQLNKKQASNER